MDVILVTLNVTYIVPNYSQPLQANREGTKIIVQHINTYFNTCLFTHIP